jgi:hypothetical protein
MLDLEPIPAILAIVEDLLDDPVPDFRALTQFDTQTLSLLRAATGAALNLQLDHPATRRALGTNALSLRTLYRLASNARIYTPNCWAFGDHGFARAARGSQKEAANMERLRTGSTISTWAWRILQDVNSSGASGTGDAEEMGSAGAAGSPSEALLASASINATAVALRAFLQGSSFNVDPRHNDILPWTAEDVSCLIESDIEILSASAELIESSCLDVPSARLEAVSPSTWADPIRYPQGLSFQNPLQLYTAFFEKAQPPDAWTGTSRTKAPEDIAAVREAAKQYAQCKAAVARGIVAIAGEDRSMEALFSSADAAWFIDTLKHWIQLREANRDDLVSIALLTLGNLARKDSHCVSMIEQHKLGDLLAPVLADPNVDVKVAHGMVGLLKNLAIPRQNKDPIGALGVIEASGRFLDKSKDMVQPLQFGTVGLLKHLCSGSVANAIKLCNGQVLDALLDINRRTEDMPTKMESTRVLFNVIKTLWGAPTDSEGALASAKSKICQPATATALAEMVRSGSKYPILVNEGIVALTLLSTSAAGAEVVADELTRPQRRGSADSEDNTMSTEHRTPRRRGTTDSLASNASQPPPPPEDALGMIIYVLSRRDARMPPQYASNACSLLIAIFEATKGSAPASTSDEMDTTKDTETSSPDTIKKIAERSVSPLELLVKQGPSEAIAAAKQALQLASQKVQA